MGFLKGMLDVGPNLKPGRGFTQGV